MSEYIPMADTTSLYYAEPACNPKTDYSKVRLLIAVKAAADGLEQRTVTRKTYQAVAEKNYPDVAVISFIAKTDDKKLQENGMST